MLKVLRRVAFHGPDAPVRAIEHIEDFRDPVDSGAAVQLDPLLQPQVRAVLRGRQDGIARDDRAIRTEARSGDHARIPKITAVRVVLTNAGGEEMKSAQLEAVSHLPDAVEHAAMPYVVG